MNYEELYSAMQPQEKALKDSLAGVQKLFKAISREMENGDIKSLTRDLNSIAEAAGTLTAVVADMKDAVSGFDTQAYFESGDFAEQMIGACKDAGVDVRGEFPVYEMFPYKVKLDTENQDIYLDRKKVQCVRPLKFVETVKKGQEKLNNASFRALSFVSELSDAYDLALMKWKKRPGADIYLSNLYKILTPMGRFRKDYDQQSFAFDLARLYASDVEETKSGRRFQFGPSRNNSKAIRILDQNGQERFLATICFYE